MKLNIFTSACVFGVLTLIGPENHAAEASCCNISLAEVVNRSDLVLLAEQATPPISWEKIPITPDGGQPDSKKYPPFKRHRERFVVREVLKGDARLSGKTLEVDAANWAEDLELHRKYYIDNINKTPAYQSYEPSSRGAHEAKRKILFLRENDGAYALTVLFAFEVEAMKSAVAELIAAKTKAPEISAAPK